MTEEIKAYDLIQGPDETRFEYAARMEQARMESPSQAVQKSQPAKEQVAAQVNADLDAIVAQSNNLQTPITLYSFGFDAEQLLTVYNALRTYLRANVQQDNEDLETIKQIAAILIDIKPRAVEASKHLTEKRNARAD